MPKLTIPLRSKGRAISYLLKLYKGEPSFLQELKDLRVLYLPTVEEWLRVSVPAWVKMKEALARNEFLIARDYFWGVRQMLPNNLSTKLEHLLPMPNPDLTQKLEAYREALDDLAYRWNLRAPWAGYVLLLDHVMDLTISMMPEDMRNIEVPVEILDPFLPSPPLPPLSLEISAYELLFSGRQEIQNRFARKLADYENKLKCMGWEELPSALETHASWWFKHYVHKKTYDEIAQMETYTPSGSLISYARNVGTAVKNFSKLIGIETKPLK